MIISLLSILKICKLEAAANKQENYEIVFENNKNQANLNQPNKQYKLYENHKKALTCAK